MGDDRIYPVDCLGYGCMQMHCAHCQRWVLARWVAGIDFEWANYEPEYLDDDLEPPGKG